MPEQLKMDVSDPLFLEFYFQIKKTITDSIANLPNKEEAQDHFIMGLSAIIGELCHQRGYEPQVSFMFISSFNNMFNRLNGGEDVAKEYEQQLEKLAHGKTILTN